MKRKVLSMLICTSMVVSQASMIPTIVNADTTEESSTGNVNDNIVNSTTSSAISISSTTSSAVEAIIEDISPNIIVDNQYTGDNGDEVGGIATYSTVSAAIASIDINNTEEKIIFIKNGIYKEKLTITTPYITLVGESAKRTILTYDDASGTTKRTDDGGDGTSTYGTTGSASVTVKASASNFKAANITISNSFDEDANSDMSSKQAVAMKNESDQSVFVNCEFFGNQDTLYANKNKQYYYNCFISGDVDFIFGGAQAVFKDCEIKSVNRDGITPKGYVAAPSTLESDKYGFLMLDCKLTSNIDEAGTVYIGRPWHPSSVTVNMISNVVYKHCYLGPHIAQDGWTTMTNAGIITQPSDNDMYEYNNYGSGANATNENRTQLTDEEADNYTVENVLSEWDPSDVAKTLSSYEENEDDYDQDEDYDNYIEADDTIDSEEEMSDAEEAFDSKQTADSEETDDSSGNVEDSTTTSAAAVIDSDNVAKQVDWNFTRFGATTSEANNTINVDNENNTVTLTSGQADGTNAGGKVTGSNDGISYYYTEIDPSENFELSASVKVNYFEKTTPDNQCAFGIMARDTLGVENDSSVSPSNMVLVGGYRANIQSVYRTGVTSDLSGTITMEGVHKFADRPANDGTSIYKLTLKKTNTGYIACVDDGEQVTYYVPKLLEVANSNKIYLGFCTARIASITVSDINLTKSEVATDPAGEEAPADIITPAINVESSSATGDTDYNLKLQTTVDGNVNVKLNNEEVYDGSADSSSVLTIPTSLNKGDNAFNIVYTPDVTENNTNTTPITDTFTVNVKSYGVESGDIYVSPDGTENGEGTIESPVDIYTAVKYIGENQTIKVKGGTYNLTSPITIEDTNNGNENSMKTLENYDGRAIFDFGKVSKGFFLNGNYWNAKGIDVTNTADGYAGLRVSGNHNTIENIKTYKNGDTGLQISSISSTDANSTWPSYNTILNCTSYDNMDAAMNNADGFAAKLTCGEGNVFKGCISHNNCDDGWDLFSKVETGKIGAVTIEDCISYGNGTLTDGTVTSGDGNGFKLGGEGLSVQHKLLNSLSFGNDAAGITSNSNPAIIVENCMSVDNDINYSLDYYTGAILNFELNNDKSFQTTEGAKADDIIDSVKDNTNYFYDGTVSENAADEQLTASMFKSTEMPTSIERDENNNIIWTDYMTLVDQTTDETTTGSTTTGDTITDETTTGSTTTSGTTTNETTIGSTTTSGTTTSGSSSNNDNSSTASDNSSSSTVPNSDDTKLNDTKVEVKNEWNQNTDGTWSFIKSNGEKGTGWIEAQDTWYYLNSFGIMQTGWIKDSKENWYYLNEKGAMNTGWFKDNNEKWYYLNNDGSMKKGWFKAGDGTWYYLNDSGDMAINTTIDGYEIDNKGLAFIKEQSKNEKYP